MWLDPAKLFLTTSVLAVVLVLVTGFVWYFLRDHPAIEIRFHWSQLASGNIAAEYIDKHGTKWSIEVKCHSKAVLPSCRNEGNFKLVLILPEDLSIEDFEKFIRHCRAVNSTGHKVLHGLVDKRSITRLNFSTVDLKVYSDFKKTLYQKALTL